MHEQMVVELDAENLELGALLAKTMYHMTGFLLGVKGHSVAVTPSMQFVLALRKHSEDMAKM